MLGFLSSDHARVQFVQFQAGDADARRSFPLLAAPGLARMAKGVGKGLPTDVISEIVNETWAIVLAQPAGYFDPARGSVEAYLRGAMYNAVKAVRAA